MTVYQLIKALERYPSDANVMILDSFNGGGVPRELNRGPTTRTVTAKDAEETADCEELEGRTVVVLGFGSY